MEFSRSEVMLNILSGSGADMPVIYIRSENIEIKSVMDKNLITLATKTRRLEVRRLLLMLYTCLIV